MFDDIEFKSSVSPHGKAGGERDGLAFTLTKKAGGVILILGINSLRKLKEMNPDANGIILKVTNDRVFAIKPANKGKKRAKGDISNQQSVTAIKENIKNIPYGVVIRFIEYKDMLVCDLRNEIK